METNNQGCASTPLLSHPTISHNISMIPPTFQDLVAINVPIILLISQFPSTIAYKQVSKV